MTPDSPHQPRDFVAVGRVGELPAGKGRQVTVNGRWVALFNLDGTFHAIDGICPHSGGPLGHGALDGPILTCPFHAWEFDCRTGEYDYDPAKRVATFQVKVEAGDIYLQVP